MKNKIILHIPHNSTRIPSIFYNQKLLLSTQEIEAFNLTMSDLYTKDLFKLCGCKKIVAPYSRKFADNDKEEMSKFGMGAIYTRTNLGKEFINLDKNYREVIINSYYNLIHKKLDKAASNLIKSSKVILVDCHSFSKSTAQVFGKAEGLPDICLGVNNIYFSQTLLEFVKAYFQNLGYSISINYPYSGAMIPDSFLNKNIANFYSIMIEVNRELYLDGFKKNSHFKTIQKQIKRLLILLKNLKID